jgi:hypothetical protein
MENLKKLIEINGYQVKGVNQHKVNALKNGVIIESSSCLEVLAIKLKL